MKPQNWDQLSLRHLTCKGQMHRQRQEFSSRVQPISHRRQFESQRQTHPHFLQFLRPHLQVRYQGRLLPRRQRLLRCQRPRHQLLVIRSWSLSSSLPLSLLQYQLKRIPLRPNCHSLRCPHSIRHRQRSIPPIVMRIMSIQNSR